MMNRRFFLASSTTLALAAGTAPASAASLKPHSNRDQSAALQKAIDRAVAKGQELRLPAGTFIASRLRVRGPVRISGSRGLTHLVTPRSEPILTIGECENVSLSGLSFNGKNWQQDQPQGGLVMTDKVRKLSISECQFSGGRCNGIMLSQTSGEVSRCEISGQRFGGLFSLDGDDLSVMENHVHDIGDNGIMIWQSKKREDGAVVANNRVEKIKGLSGGNGQNGNGILIYRAGSVTVSSNRISDCNFSAVRDNSGSNVVITGNNCSRLDEVAIFVEFAFQGAVVSDNLIEQAGLGISITNYDVGGRLAVCTNNLVRGVFGARSNPDTQAIGIAVEADTAVANNTIEDAPLAGLWLGWGYAMRNLAATGNVIRNSGIGIAVSVAKDAQQALIGNNVIAGSKNGAIVGMDHAKAVTGDLTKTGAKVPEKLMLERNLVA